eukprot:Gb_10057 [translate_table: standard]
MGGDLVTTEPTVLKVDEEDRVTVQIIKYLTLEGKFHKIFGYHIEILNSIRNEKRISIPLFLLKSLEKSIEVVKTRKGRVHLHQGLLKLLYLHEKDKRGSSARFVRGGFPRTIKTPISKAQLLLGPAPTSPILKTNAVILDLEEDSDNKGGDIPLEVSKKDGIQKRKPLPQVLTANLAKCSWRSTRLQNKSVDKSKVVDFMESIEEEMEDSDARKSVEVGNPTKDVGTGIPDKGFMKGLDGTHNLVEDLKCHLKVLNGLGGSMTSTYSCINLLTLEITN